MRPWSTALGLLITLLTACGQPLPAPPPTAAHYGARPAATPTASGAATASPQSTGRGTPVMRGGDLPTIFSMEATARVAYQEGHGRELDLRQPVTGGAVTLHWGGVNFQRVMLYLTVVAAPGSVVLPGPLLEPRLTTAAANVLRPTDRTSTPGVVTRQVAIIAEFDASQLDGQAGTARFQLEIPGVRFISAGSGATPYALGDLPAPSSLPTSGLPGPVSFDFSLPLPTVIATPQPATPLPATAKLSTQAAAERWAVAFASPGSGPPARVVQARLVTLEGAMRDDRDGNWRQAVEPSADLQAPVWLVEVDGARIGHSCPPGAPPAACFSTHMVLVVNALSGQLVGMHNPHSSAAAPTP